ncbi:penicillin acylase family protein [Polynucleobacter necessarius]|uniref:penicillin acylase family protein n=1 Tax=Polynucleobacter necessarius TaxID=576610 RepID=UPI0022B266A9|nr:penicillin acylase family protein [Polynucleobacter necessarius]
MQNVVMADMDGNIAFQAAGVAPKRILHQGLYGVAPTPGWDRQYDWNGYVPFEQLPSSNNPEQGWLATANQKIIAANDPNPLTGAWDLPARYDRIVELIKAKNIHSVDDMKKMQGDTLSLASTPLLELFKASQSTHPLASQAMEMMKNFEGDMKVSSSGALIFNAWADQLTRNLFSRLGYLFSDNYGVRNYRAPLLLQIKNPNSPWCDDPKTQAVESCQDSSNKALDKALDYLSKEYGNDPNTWAWGKAHIAILEHRPFSKVPLIGGLFNIKTPFRATAFLST